MKSLLVILAVVIFIFISFYVVVNTYERHEYCDEGESKELHKALHIALPGHTTIYYPEQEVDLQKWAGSKYNDLVAYNKDGTENSEATAGLALKAIGLFTDDYVLKEKEGHYILYRPERTEKVFTWKAFYRIGKWKKVEE